MANNTDYVLGKFQAITVAIKENDIFDQLSADALAIAASNLTLAVINEGTGDMLDSKLEKLDTTITNLEIGS